MKKSEKYKEIKMDIEGGQIKISEQDKSIIEELANYTPPKNTSIQDEIEEIYNKSMSYKRVWSYGSAKEHEESKYPIISLEVVDIDRKEYTEFDIEVELKNGMTYTAQCAATCEIEDLTDENGYDFRLWNQQIHILSVTLDCPNNGEMEVSSFQHDGLESFLNLSITLSNI